MVRGRRDKVYLTEQQRENLEQISRNGYASAKKILHARILLMCDEGETATRKWTDEEIASALQVHRNSVGRIRSRFLQIGEKPALDRNQMKSKVSWQFSTEDARVKLKHLYPVFEEESIAIEG